jgi:hypothetical protein
LQGEERIAQEEGCIASKERSAAEEEGRIASKERRHIAKKKGASLPKKGAHRCREEGLGGARRFS